MSPWTTKRPTEDEKEAAASETEPFRRGGFPGHPRLMQEAQALLWEARRDLDESKKQVAAMLRQFTAVKQRMREQQKGQGPGAPCSAAAVAPTLGPRRAPAA